MRRKFKNVFEFFVVLAAFVIPSAVWADPDSPISQVPNAGTLQHLNAQISPLLNASTLELVTDWGRVEVFLSSPDEVETFFFDAGGFDALKKTAIDLAVVGELKQTLKGSDREILISGDKHHATLKDGQQVYWGMILKPGGRAKADAVTIVMRTVPQWGVPDIVRNGFLIAHSEPIGSGAGAGNTEIVTDSTFGKAYQIFNLPLANVTYFSFKAQVRTGGVKTEFAPHFFKGPTIATVEPDLVTCCCHDTDEMLLPFPSWVYSSWQGRMCDPSYWCQLWAFVKCFRKKLLCRAVEVTDPIAKAACAEEQREFTLTITGDRLPIFKELADAQAAVHITPIDCPNVTDEIQVTRIVSSAPKELQVVVKILKCNPGKKQVTISDVGGAGTMTFIKNITVAPDTMVNDRSFGARRVVGTPEKLPVKMVTDGEIMQFLPAAGQIFDPYPVEVTSCREVRFCLPGGCNNLNAWAYEARKPKNSYFNGEVGGTWACSTEADGYTIDLIGKPLQNGDWPNVMTRDIDLEERKELSNILEDTRWQDDDHDGDKDGIKENRDADHGLYVGLNADDDNLNGRQDRDEGNARIDDYRTNNRFYQEDDLQQVLLKTVNVSEDMILKLSIGSLSGTRAKVRVWGDRHRGPNPPLIDEGNVSLTIDIPVKDLPLKDAGTATRIKELWIEGVQLSQEKRDLFLQVWHQIRREQQLLDNVLDIVDVTVIGPTVQRRATADLTASTRYGCLKHPENVTALLSQHGKMHSYVFSPRFSTPATLQTQGVIDLDLFSYDLKGKYWTGGASGGFDGTTEFFTTSSQSHVQPKRIVNNVDQEFVTDEKGGFYIVERGDLYAEGGWDAPSTVVSIPGGKAIARLFRDLHPRAGIRPPGWMVRPVRMDAGAYIVPGATHNAFRYSIGGSSFDVRHLQLDILDKSGTPVRTFANLSGQYVEGQTYAELLWNGRNVQNRPLSEDNSPYTFRLSMGSDYLDCLTAKVEEWVMDIPIYDRPAGNETLVTGPDERTVKRDYLRVLVSVDGTPATDFPYEILENYADPTGPAGNQRGCLISPIQIFYTTPREPYDIRYEVTISQITGMIAVDINGKILKTVMDGTLNPWDMDPSQPGRQTIGIWRFGIDSAGTPPKASRRDVVEEYR